MNVYYRSTTFVFDVRNCTYEVEYENLSSPYLVNIYENKVYRASYKSFGAANKKDAEIHLIKFIEKHRKTSTP